MKQKTFYKVTPFIPVESLQQTLNYYKDKLGFDKEWVMGKDGGIQRDEMRLLFGENPDHLLLINNDKYRLELVWFVDCVDEIYNEYKEKEIDVLTESTDEPWGIREFTIKDINGYLIRISETIQAKT
ncbi:MAG: VOC family protein [Cyclobacteriaceae bacterium]|nr:VOC family protein [Cyclobacteriaceae bacterium]